MTDRHEIRNAGLGIFMILTAFSFSPTLFELLNFEIKDKTFISLIIAGIIGLITSPIIGRVIATCTIVILKHLGLYYTDDARKFITKKVLDSEKYDEENIKTSKKYDSVFAAEYFNDKSKIYSDNFVAWSRRQRDGQFFSANIISSLIIGLSIAIFLEFDIDNWCLGSLNWKMLIPWIFIIIFQIFSYRIHKSTVDIAEYIWVERIWKESNETKNN